MSPLGDQVLSGEPPYGGEQDGATAFRIVSGIRPPRPINPTASHWLPDEIWDAIQSCWAQTPQSRLPSHSLYQVLAQAGPEQKKDTPIGENREAKSDIMRFIGKLVFETHFQIQSQPILET